MTSQPYRSRRHFLLAAIILGLALPTLAAAAVPVRVLFVGNSYTFYNDLPDMFTALVASGGEYQPVVKSIVDGGMKLYEHVERGEVQRELKAAASAARPWDIVVLQEQSVVTSLNDVSGGAEFRRLFHTAAAELSQRALAANPEVLVVLFQTWARHPKVFQTDPSFAANGGSPSVMMSRIHENYAAAAKHINTALPRERPVAIVCPIGDFWLQTLQETSDLPLHGPDGTHPSPTGSWFTSLLLTGSIFGRDAMVKATWEGQAQHSHVTTLKALALAHPEFFSAAAK